LGGVYRRPGDESAVAKIGLDVNALKVAMLAPDIKGIIDKKRLLASALNISGTPAFVVGDEIVPGISSPQR